MLTVKFNSFLNTIGISCSTCNSSEVALHGHDFLELMYVLSGKAIHTIEGETTTVETGDYYVIDYRTAHSYRQVSEEPFVVLNCLFTPSFIDPALATTQSFNGVLQHYLIRMLRNEKSEARPIYRFHDEEGAVKELLLRMAKEIEEKAVGYLEILRAHLITLIILSLRSSAFKEKETPVTIACKYISDHYREKITLSEIAARANYSTPHFCKRFKEETGMPFLKYVEHVRATEACRLLANTKEKITYVAEMVGYRDMTAFHEMFRRTVGMTPREYRSSIQAKPIPHSV